MKVKDLPPGTNLAAIKVQLPDDVLKQYLSYGGGEGIMYIAGDAMGDFFLSPHHPGHLNEEGKEYRRLYPMPEGVNPLDIMEWEVIL